jgi:two-component system chemotaxis sensor kinase CheA
VRVVIAADASLPQVRAFVVHKALSGLTGWKETEPAPDTLRTKELPNRTLILRFEPDADRTAIEKLARNQQGVADVQFGAPLVVERPREDSAHHEEKKGVEEDRTVRVRTALLDELIDSVGELLLARSRMKALAQKMEVPELFDLVDEVDRLTRDLNGRVVQARMTPLAFITERFPRVVRDIARPLKKSVDFHMTGTQIELDRAILDELSAPFLHMLRNSVDHAHEGDDVRRANGKNAAMKLELKASRDRDNVLLELVDDGGGIDPVRLKRRAVERGLISPSSAEGLSDQQALELICLPGFSTVEQVSQTSGRGVGMDVVKDTLARLGGSLQIHSTVGKGTRFVLTLPLTVAIIQVLVVEAGSTQDAYAIPVNRVERAIDLDAAGVSTAHGRAWLKVADDLVPLVDLAEELGFGAPNRRAGTVIVVGRGAETSAVRVDRIVGQEEVVAKPLGAPLAHIPFLSGAALLADGRAAFVLEPLRLARKDAVL